MNALRFIRIGKIPEGYSKRTGINFSVLLGMLRIDKHRLFGRPAAFTWGPMGFGEIDHRHLLTYDLSFPPEGGTICFVCSVVPNDLFKQGIINRLIPAYAKNIGTIAITRFFDFR